MLQKYQNEIQRFTDSLGDGIGPDDRTWLTGNIISYIENYKGTISYQEVLKGVEYPFNISRILVTEIGLGAQSVISTVVSFQKVIPQVDINEIEKLFGKPVAVLVQGLRKIAGLNTSKTSIHTENFIQLLHGISPDTRVILIKLAERLQLTRQIEQMEKGRREELAREVSELYAPIAHRLGLYRIKTLFEEVSMKYLHPSEYRSIARKLKESRDSREQYIAEFTKPLADKLNKAGYDCDVKGRPKSIYSIWNKMQAQAVDFEEVYDLFAIRIILKKPGANEKADCWQVYSIVTDQYQPNPNRLRDWISTPKPNGYESLHTTVIGPEGKWVEVQIRTKRMDEVAETGHAAHWRYKERKDGEDSDDWLTRIRQSLETATVERHESQVFKRELYSDQIFVFTPQGDLIKLKSGSVILDFAFAVHTNVGLHCTGAKVNGKIVPIRHQLVNGDQVEILTSPQQKPKSDWLNIVKTSKARARIKRVLKEAEYQSSEEGKETLKRKFEQWRIKYDVTTIHKLVYRFGCENALDLYQKVADNKIELAEMRDYLREKDPAEYIKEKPAGDKSIESFKKTVLQSEDYLVIDDSLDNVDYSMAKCCNPIFGDEVFGFVRVFEGTSIHRQDCPNADQLIKRYPYRIVKVRWTDKHGDKANYTVNIRISGVDDIGIVNEISKVISSDLKVNMRGMNVNSDDGFFTGLITLVVQDKIHLDKIIRRLMKVKGVLSVKRSDDI
jgi:GTP pyrophosphokinase